MTDHRLLCEAIIQRGPNAGQSCGRIASAIVVAPIGIGTLICGTHRRGWTPNGVARLAYYDKVWKGWP